MIPAFLAEGIILYDIIQMVVALIAVVLAVKWKKTELVAGLSFLFIYTVLTAFDAYLFTIYSGVFLDIAQFGFILLALVFFIIGMNPAWVHKKNHETDQGHDAERQSGTPGIFSHLRKL